MMKKHNRMNLKLDLSERNSFCLFASKHQILLKKILSGKNWKIIDIILEKQIEFQELYVYNISNLLFLPPPPNLGDFFRN